VQSRCRGRGGTFGPGLKNREDSSCKWTAVVTTRFSRFLKPRPNEKDKELIATACLDSPKLSLFSHIPPRVFSLIGRSAPILRFKKENVVSAKPG
jgi:hypothetical protein